MLVAKPFGGFGTPLSCVLLCANLVIFAVALHRARAELRARREVEILKQQTHDLAAHIKDFEKRVLGIVAVERSILKNDRTRFLPGGDWCATASRSQDLCGLGRGPMRGPTPAVASLGPRTSVG